MHSRRPFQSPAVPGHVRAVLREAGRPLDAPTRQAMEQRFGADLEAVRLHTGTAAAASARMLGAHAYTLGGHIVFGPAGYAPHDAQSQRRLAHELAHAVQQGQGGGADLAPAQREGEARAAAQSLASGSAMPRLSAATPAISRDDSGLPPVPDVTLPRGPLLGPADGAATLQGFGFNKAVLDTGHRAQLARLAVALQRLLAETPGGRVQIVGHTDLVGAEKDNDALGQQRSDAVRDALVDLGLDAASLHAHSVGESVPTVQTPRAEPRNRRVEVYFSAGSGPSLRGLMTEGLRRPEPLQSTPPTRVPGGITTIDYCRLFPKDCDPNRPPDYFKKIPDLPRSQQKGSLTDAVWGPIDKALEKGLRKLGVSDRINGLLRDAAKAGAEKGVTSVIDTALDAAGLTGDTRKAVDSALRAAAQQNSPF